MRAVEACWRAMDRAVRNHEALGVIRGNIAKPAQTSKPALLAFVPAYCSLGGAWGVLPRFYAGPLAHDWFRLAVTKLRRERRAREPVKPQEIVSAATCITQGLAQLLAFKRGTHTKIVLLQPASFTAGGGRAAKLP